MSIEQPEFRRETYDGTQAANVGRSVVGYDKDRGGRIEGQITGIHPKRSNYYVISSGGYEYHLPFFKLEGAAVEGGWHFADVTPVAAAAPGGAVRAAPDYQKMAAAAYETLNATRFALDPSKPGFDKQVAALLKSGAVRLPEPAALTKRNNGASVARHVQTLSGTPQQGAATIATIYTHKRIGDRGND